MSKESYPNSSRLAPYDAQSTAAFCLTTSQSSTNSAFASIRAANKAVQPYSTANNRSIDHGCAAIVVEATLLPFDQVSGNADGGVDSTSVSSRHVGKRDKRLRHLRSSTQKPKYKQLQSPKTPVHRLSTASSKATLPRLSTVNTQYSGDIEHEVSRSVGIEHAVSTTEVKSPVSNVHQAALPANSLVAIFSQNVNPPTFFITLPEFVSRINTTPQLALCIGLLPKGSDPINQEEHSSRVLSSGTDARLALIQSIKQDPVEQEHLRWLGARMVDEFAKNPSKDSTEIAEMVLIGPVLDNEHFRRLLSCTMTAFINTGILDIHLLQGLVQLVQSAPSEALLPSDLVKILRMLRFHLQDTHLQSSVHPFHLTLAVSRLLDVMAEHKVNDLDRVEDHEPLSGVLSGLRDSSDPYLMYQACYAFQALQYVPNNESPLQAVIRHSTGVVQRVVNVAAVFKLDLGAVLEGLGKLQEALEDVVEVVGTVYDGVCSLMESGRGVLECMKEGLSSGQRRLWYTAIHTANALAQVGRLKDLNTLIYEVPCRRDPLFQWGICQLLGEIASDNIWDTSIRLQAVDLLGELYKNDPLWGQDESVRTWMVNIIRQLCDSTHQAVSGNALALLQDLSQDQNTTTRFPYPLRNRLPLPESFPTLGHAQKNPPLEYHLRGHKVQRLEQSHMSLYIQPFAKASLRAKDNDTFPLLEKVLEFLASDRQVMLILGDSGSGKSTFNRHLEHRLWTDYKKGGPIPLFINLPAIDRPHQDLVSKHLRDNNFTEDQIQEMKQHRQFILICDGYDESQQQTNLHRSNMLNQSGRWNTKMVISCRTQFLGPTYVDRFKPHPTDRYAAGSQDLFQEAVITPFSKDQIQQYVARYIKELPTVDPLQDRPPWNADECMEKLNRIPNLMDLVSNPFLLRLALDALPSVVGSNKELSAIKLTRVQLYDGFVKRWLEVNQERLGTSTLSNDERRKLNVLIEEDSFLYHCIHYQRSLALSIFSEHAGNPVVKYNRTRDENTWKAAFFCPEGRNKLLFESSTVMRSGAFFRFLHRSLLEYFYSRTIYDPLDHDSDDHEIGLMTSLSRMNIVEEPSIIQFLCDRVSQDPIFERKLRAVIDQSKTDFNATIAATNAITILVRAGVAFHGADLRGIKIPGADLSYGQFDSSQFQKANLKSVNLSGSWLRQADLSHAQLDGVQFGELPYLKVKGSVQACAYSPDGRLFGVALQSDGLGISIYDTSSWQRIHPVKANQEVVSVVFSPDSRRIVSGDKRGVIQLCDCTSGEELWVTKGHTGNIQSLAYSPRGNDIASASNDNTVRLWDSATGMCVVALKGHTDWVMSVRFSPNGRHLVSGSKDETIRFWDSETGKPVNVWSPLLGGIYSMAISPDDRWIASGHCDGNVRLWDMVSGSSGLVLRGHTQCVTGIAFSPDGQLIATSSWDRRVKLWDASTGDVISTFDGHSKSIEDVAFSPDGLTIASGSDDGTVRLWEASSSWRNIETQDLIGDTCQVAYSPDGLSVLSVNHRKVVQRDATTGLRSSVLFELPRYIYSMTLSADGSQIAASYLDSSVQLWNSHTGVEGRVLGGSVLNGGSVLKGESVVKRGSVLKGRLSAVCILTFSTCGRWIASCGKEPIVRLLDLRNGEQQWVPVEGGGKNIDRISDLKFSPTGHQLAICSRDGIVWLFDPQTSILLTSKKLREEAILALDYSPRGDQLALGTPASVALWDLQSDEPSLELKDAASSEGPFDRWVTVAVAYSPCGQFLASANENYIVHLWRRWSVEGDKETWSCTFALCVFYGFTTSLSWNPVVPMEFMTCSENGSVRVWRVSSEEGTVAVKMLWGTNLRRLCTAGVVLKSATGLSPIHQALLAQRRGFNRGLSSDENVSDNESEDDDGFDDGLEDGFDVGLKDDDDFDWFEDGDESDDRSDDESDDGSDDWSEDGN